MKYKFIFSLIITTVLLTGCLKFNSSVKINPDGSSIVTLIYGVDKQFALMNEQFDLKEPTKEAEERGYIIEEYNGERFVGYKLTKHYETLAELSNQLDFVGMKINVVEDKGFLKNKYKVTGTMNLSGMTDENTNQFDQQIAQAFMAQLDLKFTLILPHEAGENNASKVKDDGKKLVWHLYANRENKFEVEYEKWNGLNIAFIIGGMMVVLAGWRIFQRKNAKRIV